MQAIVFLTLANAQAFQTQCDSLLGYPKPGVNIGGGVHVPPAQSVTVHECGIHAHPTLAEWAHDVTPGVASVLPQVTTALPSVPIGAPVALDNSWTPLTAAQAGAVAVA